MISYSDYDLIVNQALNLLLRDELDRTPIVYYNEFRAKDLARKAEYFRWYSMGSEKVSMLTSAETRVYKYDLSFYHKYAGDQKKTVFEKLIGDRVNHLYYFLMTKISHNVDGYKWHNLEFESMSPVLWGFDDDEEDQNIAHVDMIINIYRVNEISAVIADGGDIV